MKITVEKLCRDAGKEAQNKRVTTSLIFPFYRKKKKSVSHNVNCFKFMCIPYLIRVYGTATSWQNSTHICFARHSVL